MKDARCIGCSAWDRLQGTLLVLVALACASVAGPAWADESAMEYFEPVVTHRQFTDFVRELELDQQQRMVVELLFSDYADAIVALAQQADNEADAVGRQTILEAYSGRRLVDPAELRRLRVDVLEAYRTYWPKIDRQLVDLFDGVRSMLHAEQRSQTDAPLRQLRRAMLLHPRQVGRNSFEYAGDGVDMLQLIAEASVEGGELHGLDDALAALRSNYEAQLDALLVQIAEEHRANRMDMRLSRIRRDADALRQAEQRGLELWRELYDLNDRTARQVGEIIARHHQDSAEEMQRNWQQRFRRACFPWMYSGISSTDRQYEWLSRQQLSDDQRIQVASVYETYQQQRERLREAAIDMLLAARKEIGRVIYAMMDQSELTNPVEINLHQQMLRNTGELASAEAEATAGFESLLNDNQRAAMRHAMRR